MSLSFNSTTEAAANLSRQESDNFSMPEHILVDYIEMVVLTGMFAAGLVTNRWAVVRMHRPAAVKVDSSTAVASPIGSTISSKQRLISAVVTHTGLRCCMARQTPRDDGVARKRSIRTRIATSQSRLQLCLLISNLLVLLMYCPCKVFWLITYQWVLGACGCKLAQFLFMFVFSLSSNIVACIALTRALSIRRLFSTCKPMPGVGGGRRTLTMPLCSVVLAVLVSLPQLVVFDIVAARAPDGRVVFVQCVTIWEPTYLASFGRTAKVSAVWALAQLGVSADVYETLHIVVVFWAPFAAILVSYAYVVVRLVVYSLRPLSTTNNNNPTALTAVTAAEDAASTDELQPLRPVSGAVALNRAYSPTSVSSAPVSDRQRGGTAGSGGGVPAWRGRMRGRMFRTTGTIVLCYCLFWLPYNAIVAAGLFAPQLRRPLSDYSNWLQCLIVLNSVVNPLLYDFKGQA